MATSGENSRPSMGKNEWPLTIVAQAGRSLVPPISLADDPTTHTFVRNAARDFAVDMRAETSIATVRLVLLSEEIEGKRSWRWTEDVEFSAPPASGRVHPDEGYDQFPRGLFS